MQSILLHCGYGYSKKLCEKSSLWFLNNFLDDYDVKIEFNHHSLKKYGVNGFCTFLRHDEVPNSFIIDLDTHMNQDLYLKTIFHELTHVKQWVTGKLQLINNYLYYEESGIDDFPYDEQPHEIEAKINEEDLYQKYIDSQITKQ